MRLLVQKPPVRHYIVIKPSGGLKEIWHPLHQARGQQTLTARIYALLALVKMDNDLSTAWMPTHTNAGDSVVKEDAPVVLLAGWEYGTKNLSSCDTFQC